MEDLFTYSSIPVYFPGTDVQLFNTRDQDNDEGISIPVRVYGPCDDRDMWDVQFYSEVTRNWHGAPSDMAKAILKHIEANDTNRWSDILAASGREAA